MPRRPRQLGDVCSRAPTPEPPTVVFKAACPLESPGDPRPTETSIFRRSGLETSHKWLPGRTPVENHCLKDGNASEEGRRELIPRKRSPSQSQSSTSSPISKGFQSHRYLEALPAHIPRVWPIPLSCSPCLTPSSVPSPTAKSHTQTFRPLCPD